MSEFTSVYLETEKKLLVLTAASSASHHYPDQHKEVQVEGREEQVFTAIQEDGGDFLSLFSSLSFTAQKITVKSQFFFTNVPGHC